MTGRIGALIYGIASYLIFSLSFAYTPAFVGNYWVPKSIDVGPESGLVQSIVIDAALLGIFAVDKLADPLRRRLAGKPLFHHEVAA